MARIVAGRMTGGATLEDMRATLSRAEYCRVLELAGEIVKAATDSGEHSGTVLFALYAATAMYTEAADHLVHLLKGRE